MDCDPRTKNQFLSCLTKGAFYARKSNFKN